MQAGALDAREGASKYIHVSIQPDEKTHVVITDPTWPQDPNYALTQLGKALLELDSLKSAEVSDIFQRHGIRISPIPSRTGDHNDT